MTISLHQRLRRLRRAFVRLQPWLAGMATIALCALAATVQPAHAADAVAIELPFSAFYRQPVGPRGLEISDALRAADGHVVRLVGYMVAQEEPLTGRFLLTPRPVRMSEHADGDADDLPPTTVTVELDASQRARVVTHQAGLLAVTGRLSVGREEAADGRVTWVRLLLAPEALAAAELNLSRR